MRGVWYEVERSTQNDQWQSGQYEFEFHQTTQRLEFAYAGSVAGTCQQRVKAWCDVSGASEYGDVTLWLNVGDFQQAGHPWSTKCS